MIPNSPDASDALDALDEFRAAVEPLRLERLQEIYAATFDVNPACCLYPGYHLFGESYKRGAFMAKLNGEYRERGFEPGNDLPDHLPTLLRFLATLDDSELRSWLVIQAIVPGLQTITAAFEGTENPYGSLVRAALLALRPVGYVAPEEAGARSLPILRTGNEGSHQQSEHGTRV